MVPEANRLSPEPALTGRLPPAKPTPGGGGDAPVPVLKAQGVAVAAGGRVIQSGIDVDVRRGEILAIVGPSGCGKSTLLRHLVGLERPRAGRVWLQGEPLHEGDEDRLAALRRRIGVMFQAGALWSSMTLGENLMLPMQLFGPWSPAERVERARERLARVGLDEAFDLRPAQLSGGMRKRAALARSLALDPPLLCLDEPGSGLDPLNSARLDELVLRLRQDLGTTVVMVTHEVASLFAVADRILYLDDETCTMTALGPPADLRDHGPATVRRFLATRGSRSGGAGGVELLPPAGRRSAVGEALDDGVAAAANGEGP